jgi:hypothetical protein
MHINASVSIQTVRMMMSKKLIDGVENGKRSSTKCDTCETAKQTMNSFKDSEAQSNITSVCSDIVGPIIPISHQGYKYIVPFVNMKTRLVCAYSMRKKSETLSKFKDFMSDMRTLCDLKIKILRSDNDGEYTSREFKELCKRRHIKQEFTVAYNPEQNGMCKRMNRRLVEMTRYYGF